MVDTGVSIVIPKNECVRIDLRVEGNMFEDGTVLCGTATVRCTS